MECKMKNKLLFGALLSGLVFLGAGCATDAPEEEPARENTTPLEEGPGSNKGVGGGRTPPVSAAMLTRTAGVKRIPPATDSTCR